MAEEHYRARAHACGGPPGGLAGGPNHLALLGLPLGVLLGVGLVAVHHLRLHVRVLPLPNPQVHRVHQLPLVGSLHMELRLSAAEFRLVLCWGGGGGEKSCRAKTSILGT